MSQIGQDSTPTPRALAWALASRPPTTSWTAGDDSTARRTIRCTERVGVGLTTVTARTPSGRSVVHNRGITAMPIPAATNAIAVGWFVVRTE